MVATPSTIGRPSARLVPCFFSAPSHRSCQKRVSARAATARTACRTGTIRRRRLRSRAALASPATTRQRLPPPFDRATATAQRHNDIGASPITEHFKFRGSLGSVFRASKAEWIPRVVYVFRCAGDVPVVVLLFGRTLWVRTVPICVFVLGSHLSCSFSHTYCGGRFSGGGRCGFVLIRAHFAVPCYRLITKFTSPNKNIGNRLKNFRL